MTLGTMMSPAVKQAIMNTAIWMMSMTRASLLISLPWSMGVSMDSIMTCPISSMMVTRISVSMCSLSRLPWDFRTAVTTAVLEPDMIHPRQMLCSMSNPRMSPEIRPPATISGNCTIATIRANFPWLLS